MSSQVIRNSEPAPDEPRRPPGQASLRIFLNYRREDSSGHAGRLYDDLAERFQEANVFIDIDKIEPGLDFADAIDRALDDCDVVLALIGRQWLTTTDAGGRRRIDNPHDYVRLELEATLARGTRLIPVRVQGAEMPSSVELPEPLRALARRHAVELSDTRWRHDVESLAAVLDRLSADRDERDRLAREAAERERLVAEAAEREGEAREQAERERVAAEAASLERPRVESEQAERERLARETSKRERQAREQVETERRRLAAEVAERERLERQAARREREAEKRRLAEEQKNQARLARERRRAASASAPWWRRSRRAFVAAPLAILGVGAVVAIVLLGGGGDPPTPAPTVVKRPAISGTARVGQTLTASRGTWSGSPTSFAFQWRRCKASAGACRAIRGADGREHRVTVGDVGRRLLVSVAATNAGGSLRSESKPTQVVPTLPKPPVNIGLPVLSGTTLEGSTLTATTGKWNSSSRASFAFAWKRCNAAGGDCARIGGASKRSYALGTSDIGRTIRVEVKASNRAGETTAVSRPAGLVTEKPAPAPTPSPTPSPEPEPTTCPPVCPTFP